MCIKINIGWFAGLFLAIFALTSAVAENVPVYSKATTSAAATPAPSNPSPPSRPVAGATGSASGTATAGKVTLTAAPTTFSIDPKLEEESHPVRLEITVPKHMIGTEKPDLQITPTPEVKGSGTSVTIAHGKEDLIVETDSAGKPTGKLSQVATVTFAGVPRLMPATTFNFRLQVNKAQTNFAITAGNSNAVASGATIALETPSEQRLDLDKGIKLILTAIKADAPRLSIVAGPFTSSDTKRVIPHQICVPADEDSTGDENECRSIDEVIDLRANSYTEILLKAKPEDAGWLGVTPGEYKGKIRALASNGLSASQDVTLLVINNVRKALGTIMIIFGVWLSYLISVRLPYRAQRGQRMLPFIGLNERLDAVREKLAMIDFAPDDLLKEIEKARYDASMDGLIAHNIVGASDTWAPVAGLATAEKAAAHFAKTEKIVIAIEKLVRAIANAPTATVRTELGALAGHSDFPTNLDDKIDAIFTAHKSGGARGFSAAMDDDPIQRMPTRREIYMSDVSFSRDSTLILGGITAISGAIVLIAMNPIFGSITDLCIALAWGFGFTFTGTQISERKAPSSFVSLAGRSMPA